MINEEEFEKLKPGTIYIYDNVYTKQYCLLLSLERDGSFVYYSYLLLYDSRSDVPLGRISNYVQFLSKVQNIIFCWINKMIFLEDCLEKLKPGNIYMFEEEEGKVYCLLLDIVEKREDEIDYRYMILNESIDGSEGDIVEGTCYNGNFERYHFIGA